ncbi:MAG TPA: hypothetical protein VK162_20095 [Streptosporangiaceae bacterium]|nr:hypothetical protein [Streptosporangiaceae bacterium]
MASPIPGSRSGWTIGGIAGLLIVARVVQGAGGAVVVPLTLTLISDAFPAEKREQRSGSGAESPASG